MIHVIKSWSIAAVRYLWLNEHIAHDDYDWWLIAIKATPEDIYMSPFWY